MNDLACYREPRGGTESDGSKDEAKKISANRIQHFCTRSRLCVAASLPGRSSEGPREHLPFILKQFWDGCKPALPIRRPASYRARPRTRPGAAAGVTPPRGRELIAHPVLLDDLFVQLNPKSRTAGNPNAAILEWRQIYD